MDFNDATHDIQKKYPTLNTGDLRNMMDDEVRSEEERLSKERGIRDKYQRAVNAAHERILLWLATADDYAIDDVASFIATHRRACAWAVLVGQRLKEEQEAEPGFCCELCGKDLTDEEAVFLAHGDGPPAHLDCPIDPAVLIDGKPVHPGDREKAAKP